MRTELRAQQERFSQVQADMRTCQEEAIVNALAVFASSRMGTRSFESEQTCTPVSMEVGQYTPAVNALVDAASEQKMRSYNGFSGVQTPCIYLTPPGGANAVHLNTGNYVTPELFSPPSTVSVSYTHLTLPTKRIV